MESTQITLHNKIEQFLNGEAVQLTEAELDLLGTQAYSSANENAKLDSVVDARSKFLKNKVETECNEILDIPCYVTMPID